MVPMRNIRDVLHLFFSVQFFPPWQEEVKPRVEVIKQFSRLHGGCRRTRKEIGSLYGSGFS